MAREPYASDAEQAAIAALIALEAVTEMAMAPPQRQHEVALRFHQEVERHPLHSASRQGFIVATGRLLFTSVKAFATPATPTSARLSQEAVMLSLTSLLDDYEPEVRSATRAAVNARSINDFMHALGDRPPCPRTLGTASAAVLREVLDARGARRDPWRRWYALARIRNDVAPVRLLGVR